MVNISTVLHWISHLPSYHFNQTAFCLKVPQKTNKSEKLIYTLIVIPNCLCHLTCVLSSLSSVKFPWFAWMTADLIFKLLLLNSTFSGLNCRTCLISWKPFKIVLTTWSFHIEYKERLLTKEAEVSASTVRIGAQIGSPGKRSCGVPFTYTSFNVT